MLLEERGFEFEEFFLDTREKVLLQRGKPLQVAPKSLQLLLALVENHGHIVEKRALMELVWPDSFVEESNLTFTVRQLRKALGDEVREPRFIETVPRRGYRFVAEVRPVRAPATGNDSAGDVASTEDQGIPWARELLRRPVLSLLVITMTAGALVAGFLIFRERRSDFDASGLAANQALKFETVVSSGVPMTTAISADGKYIAYSNTVNGRQSLWLRQLASRTNTQLLEQNDGTIFSHLEFSRDGENIYFTARRKDEPTHLDRISVLGGVVRGNLLTGLDGSFSFSPDDRLISFRRYEPQKRSLFVANIDGTDARPIYETSKTFTDNVFSPDGSMIAFASGQSDTGDPDFGVYTVDITTGSVRPATEYKWFHVRSIVWLPDQSALLVTARMKNDAPHQIWRISLESGDVRQLTDTQDDLVTLATSADLTQTVLTQLSLSSNLYIASLAQPDDARPISSAYNGVAWAPGGELVYSANATGNADIWMVDTNRANPKQLTTETSTDQLPVVSPDGRYIVFVSDRGGKFNIWRMSASGRDLTQLTTGDGESDPTFAPDGRTVLYTSVENGSLWKVPIAGGEPVPISTKPSFDVSVSTDGARIAQFGRSNDKTTIFVRSVSDGDTIQAFDITPGSSAAGRIVWTPDGQALIYSAEDSNFVGNLWQQPLAGGDPQRLTSFTSDEIFGFDVSDDGSELAIVRGTWNHNIVFVKGLADISK